MSQIVKSIEGRLAESLKDALAKNPHLARYLDNLAKRGQKLPDYVEQLSREMRYAREVNIIYPVGDPIFIHIKSKKPGERPLYIVIQPAVDERIYKIIDLVEEILISQIDENIEFNTPEEHEEALRNILKRIIKIDWGLKTGEFKIDKKSDSKKIYVNNETYRSLEYQLIMDKVYLGILEPFIRDEYIEDISCDGVGPIFVEHKIFGSCESNILFKNEYELDNFARRLSERTGRPATFRNPIVDASLPDGSRINIVFGKDLSMRGTNFTIRKFSDKPLSIVQIIKYGGISALGAAYLWILLENNMSIWFCGEAASGKTTLLRAVCVFINPHYKIISIEDTPEIIVPHDNWVREVTRQSEAGGSSIELFDLLKAALRQRPNYIIVGEIRGKEASVAFQAMQTGAPVLATFHAGSVEKLIQRLTGSPIEIPKTYIDILNAVVIQSSVRIPSTGKIERRVLSINEIVGYDPGDNRFDYIELFSWQPNLDSHEFRGEGSSHLLENRIAVMKGISRRDLRKIYVDLEMRAELLSTLARLNVTDYFHVWRVIKYTYNTSVEEALKQISLGEKIWESEEA
ncbi:MAG: type II/IV secretion system ATPase subunit [Thaumarchaeota archaeon]|jgi:archaeal flagellar protein FlaI|nr:type II/IV secretion system ATPase subunit [Candidatus Geocrenenecus arthurdayi]MCL7403396.1 type II/IV secretion system ATPase subunit [Candidatus Geocrenenecus arthurdayi]